MRTLIVTLFAALPLLVAVGAATEDLDAILKGGISNNVYPAVAALIGSTTEGKYLYHGAFGTYEYLYNNSQSPSVSLDNLFDLASVSKVIATTTAVGLLYQRGYLDVTDHVTKYIGSDSYAQHGKDAITLENCLLHNAGYAPDPVPDYYTSNYSCPNTADYHPAEDFSCMTKVYDTLMNESLNSVPGEKYVYSDLSFITLQFVVGSIVSSNALVTTSQLTSQCQSMLKAASGSNVSSSNPSLLFDCYFEAFIRCDVFQSAVGCGASAPSESWVPTMGYLPSPDIKDQCVPTNYDDTYRHQLIQGVVSDGNCYSMGGVCGHAGLFTTPKDMGKFLWRLVTLASLPEDAETVDVFPGWLNATTVKFFIRERNATQSSRALGWTINDPTVDDYGFRGSCGNLSTKTFMHIGYTGTCVCVDPVNKLWSVVLTNRVYNMGSSDAVKAIYKNLHNTFLASYEPEKL